MIAKVKGWLEDGIVDLFLGYKMVMGHPLPHCFVKEKIKGGRLPDHRYLPLFFGKNRHPHQPPQSLISKSVCWPATATSGP